MGIDPLKREHICHLIAHHALPIFLIEDDDAERRAITASALLRCDLLAMLSEADVRGRLCNDKERLLENIALFVETCRELDCLLTPYPFPDEHTAYIGIDPPTPPRRPPPEHP